MIEFVKAFKTSDGLTHATLEESKIHELTILFQGALPDEKVMSPVFAKEIMKHSDLIVDILTTTATSKPKARKVNGGTKTRKPKPAATPPAQ